MRRWGYSNPEFRSAARMRSTASRTAPSGSPTVVVCGRPEATSTSTSTTIASMPRRAPERTRASMTWHVPTPKSRHNRWNRNTPIAIGRGHR